MNSRAADAPSAELGGQAVAVVPVVEVVSKAELQTHVMNDLFLLIMAAHLGDVVTGAPSELVRMIGDYAFDPKTESLHTGQPWLKTSVKFAGGACVQLSYENYHTVCIGASCARASVTNRLTMLAKCVWDAPCRLERGRMRIMSRKLACVCCEEPVADLNEAYVLWQFHVTEFYHYKEQHGQFLDPMKMPVDKACVLVHKNCAQRIKLSPQTPHQHMRVSEATFACHHCNSSDEQAKPANIPCNVRTDKLPWCSETDLVPATSNGCGWDCSEAPPPNYF